MARRTISTRVAIDGEAEYRRSLTNINSELRKLKSELKVTESEFKENANSIEALTAKQRALKAVQSELTAKVKAAESGQKNAQKAVDAYEKAVAELNSELAENKKALEELDRSSEDAAEQEEKLTKEADKLNKELKEKEAALEAAKRGLNNWETTVNNAQAELNDFNREVEKNEKYLNEAKASADGYATSIDKFGKEAKQTGKDSEDAFDAMGAALVAAGVDMALEKIVEILRTCARASIEFESAMAGVAKTTNLTGAELDSMGDKFKLMSTQIPVAANELAGLAEIAGQLGITNIVEFTEVIAKLGTATNMTSEDAATMIAQFANITGLGQDEYENLGSAIVDLGNKSATTESAIMEMAQRFASAASVAGLSETDILGFSAALSSLGIEAEAGGSALSTFTAKVQLAVETGDGLNDFATVAGMTAQDFRKAWGEDAAGALTAFITGLSNTERNGKSAIAVLSDMGITEVRLRNAILSLSESGDLLTDSLNISSSAFQKNNALAKEAETRYATTESKITMYENSVTNLQAAFGDQLNPMMQNTLGIGRDLNEWAEEMIEENEWLAPTLTAVGIALGVAGVALAGYTVSIKIAEVASKAFGNTLNGIPIFAIVTAIVAATAALSALALSMYEADDESTALAESTKQLADNMEQSADAFEKTKIEMKMNSEEARLLIGQLGGLISITDKTVAEQGRLEYVVGKLNEIYPDLGLSVNETTGEIIDSTGAVVKNTDAILENVEAIEKQEEAIAINERLNEVQEEQIEAQTQMGVVAGKVNNLLGELNDTQKELVEQMMDGYLPSAAEMIAAGALTDETFRTVLASMNELGGETEGLAEQMGNATEEEEILRQKLEELNAQELINTYGTADLTTKQQEMADKATALNDRLVNLKTAYETAYTSAYESINGQMGLWEDMGEVEATSAKKANDALESQITYLANYSANMDSLMNRNIEGIEILAQSLSDGSTESAAILAGLTDASDEEIQEMITNLGEIEKGKQKFSETIAKMQTDFQGQMDAILKDLDGMVEGLDRYEDTKEAAEDTAQGFIDGLEGKLGEIRSLANQIAQSVGSATKKYNEISSPSRLMKRMGINIGEGYIQGLQAEIDRVQKEGMELAKAARGIETRNTPDVTAFENVVNNSYGGNVNVKLNVNVNGKMTDREIQKTTDKMIYEIRKKLGRRI